MSEDVADKVQTFIDGISQGDFLSPLSWSAKNQIELTLANKIFLMLTMEGFLDIYTVPEFNNNLMTEYAIKGIINDPTKFEVQDPEDFHPVEPSELKLVTLYLKHVNE